MRGQAGLARSRRQANSVIYTAVPEALGGLMLYILDDCCGGRPELLADIFKVAELTEPDAVPSACRGPARTDR